MTNEEAIRNLVYSKRWRDIPNEEAIDMAIKALEDKGYEQGYKDGWDAYRWESNYFDWND